MVSSIKNLNNNISRQNDVITKQVKNKINKLVLDLDYKSYDAPNESLTIKLIEENSLNTKYNILFFLDRYWAINQKEGDFIVENVKNNKTKYPIFIGDSKEELIIAINYYSNNFTRLKNIFFKENWFFKVLKNVYLISIPKEVASRKLSEVPAYKNSKISLINLFDPSNEPITIICINPSRTCNYRCPYCYHHDHGFNKNPSAMTKWSETILTATKKIQRPIKFSAGSMGEPLIIPKWRETAIKVLEKDNVISLSFVSNLFFPIEPFFDHVDPNKVGLMASLHPSQFKDHDNDFKNFLNKLERLKNLGVDLVVNYVLAPGQIEKFKDYKKIINNLGISTTSNVLRGPYEGKVYPQAFTKKELELVSECYDENSYIFDSQSHLESPYGKKCMSGKTGFELLFDGTLINCGFARNRFGSIYDDDLYVRSENGFCTGKKCECQTLIGWQIDVAEKFEVQRTLQHYKKR